MSFFKSLLLVCTFAICMAIAPHDARAQDSLTPDLAPEIEARFDLYERQLNAILKTRRDEEKLFVKRVVDQVKLKKISSKLVNTSFQWVRNKRPGTKYPFVYFERVLRLQATKLELEDEIPPFDYGIYSEYSR